MASCIGGNRGVVRQLFWRRDLPYNPPPIMFKLFKCLLSPLFVILGFVYFSFVMLTKIHFVIDHSDSEFFEVTKYK